jgi:hypothetical protein
MCYFVYQLLDCNNHFHTQPPPPPKFAEELLAYMRLVVNNVENETLPNQGRYMSYLVLPNQKFVLFAHMNLNIYVPKDVELTITDNSRHTPDVTHKSFNNNTQRLFTVRAERSANGEDLYTPNKKISKTAFVNIRYTLDTHTLDARSYIANTYSAEGRDELEMRAPLIIIYHNKAQNSLTQKLQKEIQVNALKYLQLNDFFRDAPRRKSDNRNGPAAKRRRMDDDDDDNSDDDDTDENGDNTDGNNNQMILRSKRQPMTAQTMLKFQDYKYEVEKAFAEVATALEEHNNNITDVNYRVDEQENKIMNITEEINQIKEQNAHLTALVASMIANQTNKPPSFIEYTNQTPNDIILTAEVVEIYTNNEEQDSTEEVGSEEEEDEEEEQDNKSNEDEKEKTQETLREKVTDVEFFIEENVQISQASTADLLCTATDNLPTFSQDPHTNYEIMDF